MKTKRDALVLIDIQKGFDDPACGPSNKEGFAENVEKLLTTWRERRMPVIHVHHLTEFDDSPLHPKRRPFAASNPIFMGMK